MPTLVASNANNGLETQEPIEIVEMQPGKNVQTPTIEIGSPMPSDEILESKSEPEDEMMRLYSTVTGESSYYYSIYDKEPMGKINKKGTIVKYYALKDGLCVTKIDTEQQLREFIKEQGENIRNFEWKAVIFAHNENEAKDLENFIDSDTPVPSTYITFFVDYVPSLNIDFDYSTPTY